MSNKIYNPFIKTRDSVWRVMSDVLVALVPCALISYFAFGTAPFLVMLVAVVSAVIAEFLFLLVFFRKKDSLKDGSALVTAILLAFTLAPFTPWYIVAFGAAMAVIFGKLLWGGLGKNLLNPALVGREFMTIFFPSVMTSGAIWYNKEYANLTEINLFGASGESGWVDFMNNLLFRPSGAVGEYSALLLITGGLFLLLRNRISWHIPFGLFVTFVVILQGYVFFFDGDPKYSLGGVLLGTIFMATDMPSSPVSNAGKLFYGAMIGLSASVFIIMDIRYEYMSYSILLINGFVFAINWAFRVRTWAENNDSWGRIWKSALIVAGVVAASILVVYLHNLEWIKYLVYVFIVFIICRFCFVTMKQLKRTSANR